MILTLFINSLILCYRFPLFLINDQSVLAVVFLKPIFRRNWGFTVYLNHILNCLQQEKDNSEKSEQKPSESKENVKESKVKERRPFTDCYNGATYENYSWSQTIGDLDVNVKLPPDVTKSNQVKVDLTAESMSVSILKPSEIEWQNLVKGNFTFRIKQNDSFWCLEPGQRINVNIIFSKYCMIQTTQIQSHILTN